MVKVSLAWQGTVLLRMMSLPTAPPSVSMPSDSGVTSSSSVSRCTPGQDARLHGRPQRDHLVGIDGRVRLAAEELLHPPQHHGIRVQPPTITTWSIASDGHSGVGEGLAAVLDGAVDPAGDARASNSCARDVALVQPALPQVDLHAGGGFRGQADLRRPRRSSAAPAASRAGSSSASPNCWRISAGDQVDQLAVQVVAAQVGVAVGAEHLEDPARHAQDGDVERPAAQVVDGDGGVCPCGPARRPARRPSAR